MTIITINWDKYIKVQWYLLSNLDILTIKMNNGNVDIHFRTEEDASVFRLRYAV